MREVRGLVGLWLMREKTVWAKNTPSAVRSMPMRAGAHRRLSALGGQCGVEDDKKAVLLEDTIARQSGAAIGASPRFGPGPPLPLIEADLGHPFLAVDDGECAEQVWSITRHDDEVAVHGGAPSI